MDESINDVRLMLIQISHDFERLSHDLDILGGCLYSLKEKQNVESKSKRTGNKQEDKRIQA